MEGKYAVIRTYSAGVHAGVVKSINGKEVTLTNARRLWYWKGAFTLNAIALKGVGEGSKISEAVPEILLTEAIEVIPATEEAQKNLTEFAAHTPCCNSAWL
jgi:hypothetical protein